MRDAIDLNLEAIRPPFVPFEHKSIRVLLEKRMEKRKDIYISTILRIFHSFCDKPVLAGKSVDAARNVSVQWQ